ncbi:hypothetical protein BDV93DRAFT_516564 [Ceratobasidium sp. AG-I]|nr:hypothetical protein BDV93DRAFT_516564 [Ceratobasidium sp. AG-I]
MAWYRTLLGIVAWIVILAPILPVSPMANLAGPLPSSLHTSRSSIAHRLLNLESVLHPSTLGHKVFSFNAPPRPPFNIVLPSHGTKESASRPALIRHAIPHMMPGTKPPTLWSRAGGRTRQALWRGRLRWITPVLDTIIHPSTTPTGKADVAPTSTWTTTNPAPPQVAPGLSRGPSYADGFKSCSASSAFLGIFDVGRDVRNWIASVGARLLLAIEDMVDYADRGQQQALFTTEVIVKESPRWSAICFADGRKLVVDNWPASERLLSTVEALPSTFYSLARRTVSDALVAIRAPLQGFPSWSAACTWILKKIFVFFQLPALVIFWVSWARLLPLMGYDPRLVSRQLREMTQPGFWNVQDTVVYVLVQRVLQAEADHLRRYEPAPSESEGSEWECENDGPFPTNGEWASSPFDVQASVAEVELTAGVEA